MSDEERYLPGRLEIVTDLRELIDEGVGWVLDKHDVRMLKRAIRKINDLCCWIDIMKAREDLARRCPDKLAEFEGRQKNL